MKCTTVTISKCTVQGIKSIVGHVPSYHSRGVEGSGGDIRADCRQQKDPVRSLPGVLDEGMKKLILPACSTDKWTFQNTGKQGRDTIQKQMGIEFYFFP